MSIYQAAYNKLTKSNQHLKEEWKPVGSGLERHRIIPKHQGGIYVDSNCTYLTRKQHIFAHWLLWKIHRNEGDRKAYHWMKGNKIPAHLGIPHSEETKLVISKKLRGRPGKPWSEKSKRKLAETNRKRQYSKLSEEAKRNMAEGQRKRTEYTYSKEAKDNMSKAQRGRKHSEETKAKMRKSQQLRRKKENVI